MLRNLSCDEEHRKTIASGGGMDAVVKALTVHGGSATVRSLGVWRCGLWLHTTSIVVGSGANLCQWLLSSPCSILRGLKLVGTGAPTAPKLLALLTCTPMDLLAS